MLIPIIGNMEKNERFGGLYSDPISLPILKNNECRVVLEEYESEESKDEVHEVIGNFVSAKFSVLEEAQDCIYQYYLDMKQLWLRENVEIEPIEAPNLIWAHIEFGSEAVVSRRASGAEEIYVSLECNCSWEQEHGLQIVLKGGNKVCKVGPYDGHLTNSDAYANPSLENVVYKRLA